MSNFSYTKAPNEIVVSNDSGLVECLEDFIGFGGDMEPDDLQKERITSLFGKNIFKRYGKIPISKRVWFCPDPQACPSNQPLAEAPHIDWQTLKNFDYPIKCCFISVNYHR